jgi:hypothetical protein
MSQLSISRGSSKLLYGLLALTLVISGFTFFRENNSDEIASAAPVKPNKTNRSKSASIKYVTSPLIANSLGYNRSFYNPSVDIFAVPKIADEKPPESTHTEIITEAKIQTVDLSPVAALQQESPPSAPPVPFKYIGKLYGDDEYTVFLHLNGRNISVKTGDTIAQSYKIEEINPPLMSATYLPLNIKQTIDIGAP